MFDLWTRLRCAAISVIVLCVASGSSSRSTRIAPLVIPLSHINVLEPMVTQDPDLSEAVADGQREVMLEPSSATAWMRLGMIYDIHEHMLEAVECYGRAVRLAPDDAQATYFLAHALDQADAPVGEIELAYQRAIQLAPRYAPARLRLAEALFKVGLVEKARAAFEGAIRTYPPRQAARARRGLGNLQLASDEIEAGVASLESVVAIRADDGPTWSGLSRGYLRLGRHADSMMAAERSQGLVDRLGYFDEWRLAVLEEAVMPVLVEQRINAKMGMGRPEDAMADALRWERRHPDWPSIKRLIGNLYRELGREELAQQYFEAAKQTVIKRYNK